MKKQNAFTLAEIFVVLGLIVLTALLVIPNLIEDNKKLDSISKWKHSYQNIEYIFSAIYAQINYTDVISFKNAKNSQEKEELMFEMLNPYFRMTDKVSPKDYKVVYLNGSEISQSDDFYITNYHKTTYGEIIGLKWLKSPTKYYDNLPIAMISVDLNGLNKPNKWGYDIFGVNIFRNRIEPIGKANDDLTMKSDCSKKGKGVACSYYYYIYGGKLN